MGPKNAAPQACSLHAASSVAIQAIVFFVRPADQFPEMQMISMAREITRIIQATTTMKRTVVLNCKRALADKTAVLRFTKLDTEVRTIFLKC